jgi:outer membrane protein assembly factor BamB
MIFIARTLCVLSGLIFCMNLGIAAEAPEPPLIVAIMDPLAAPLSCPCVKGYAQRDYDKLGAYLQEKLGRPVKVVFGESLDKALKDEKDLKADLVIGKYSVVLADAKRNKHSFTPLAALTGRDGGVNQRGLIVVRGDDPAQSVGDLKGYKIILGPVDCDEKNLAPRILFTKHGIKVPADCQISEACSDGATAVIEAGVAGKTATVISSYAQPLLEGCGTIKKGDLKVVGETEDVSFITAFISEKTPAATVEKIRDALLAVDKHPLLRLALESKHGFVALSEATSKTSAIWPGWRGLRRDGHVANLPVSLPTTAIFLWTKPLFSDGMGGIAADESLVIVGDRDSADLHDLFHAFDANTGERRWSLRYPVEGHLDYGNAPRATPLIAGDYVYVLGAFGHLYCVRSSDGRTVWKRDLRVDFQVKEESAWGVASSPLIVDGKLIVNPGGADASLVALNPSTGEVVWKSPGQPAAFSSFIEASFGGYKQIIGFDKISLGGWDVANGKRLWTIKAEVPGDFNVPTPLLCDDRLIVATENNGCRAYHFDAVGMAALDPESRAPSLAPDMHTPVYAAGRIFALDKGRFHCLDSKTLKTHWSFTERKLMGYSSLIASADRVLAISHTGEAILLDATADEPKILSRLQVTPSDVRIYAHPAVVGNMLYLRGPNRLYAMSLNGK